MTTWAEVVRYVEHAGGQAFVSSGVTRTIVGVVGDDAVLDPPRRCRHRPAPGCLLGAPRITSPYKLVSPAELRQDLRPPVSVAGVPIGPDTFTLIAGPCAVESPEQTLASAQMACHAGATLLRGGAYKPRTSPYAFQGLGADGLRILADVRTETGLPIVTEVVDADDVPTVVEYADMLQVGTRNMSSFALLAGGGRVRSAGDAQTGFRGDVRRMADGRRIHRATRQSRHRAVRAGNPDLRDRDPQHPRHLRRPEHACDVAPAGHHRPLPRCRGGEIVVPLARAGMAAGADGVISGPPRTRTECGPARDSRIAGFSASGPRFPVRSAQ